MKFLTGIFGFDRLGRMLPNHPVKLAITRIIISFDLAVGIKAFLSNGFNGIGSQIRHCFHYEVPQRIVWPTFLTLRR